MLADLNATHLTEQELAYLAELNRPVVVFVKFLQMRYGANAVAFNNENGQIIRQQGPPVEILPQEPAEHATANGKAP